MQREGCTFYWVWSRFRNFSIAQESQNEVFDAVDHLCAKVYPFYTAYPRCFHYIAYEDVRQRCNVILTTLTKFSFHYTMQCSIMPVVTNCYNRFIQPSCIVSVEDLVIMVLYYERFERLTPILCDLNVKGLTNNATVDVNDCDVNSYFNCFSIGQTGHLSSSSDILFAQRRCEITPNKTTQRLHYMEQYYIMYKHYSGCTSQDIYQYLLSLGNWSNNHQRRYNSQSEFTPLRVHTLNLSKFLPVPFTTQHMR